MLKTDDQKAYLLEEILAQARANYGNFPHVQNFIVMSPSLPPIEVEKVYAEAIKKYAESISRDTDMHRVRVPFSDFEVTQGSAGYGHRIWARQEANPAFHFLLKKHSKWKGSDKRDDRDDGHVYLAYEFSTDGLRKVLNEII